MPDAVTLKVRPATRDAIRDMADRCGTTMQDLIDKLVEDRLNQQFFEEMNAAWTQIRADDAAWTEETRERELWDNTLEDSLS